MGKWNFNLNVKQFLSDTRDFEEIKEIAVKFHNEMQKHPLVFKHFSCLEDFEVFEVPEGYSAFEWFNDLLDHLYYFADDNRIWIG